MLLLQLNITYTCSSDKGYKTANLYVRVMGELSVLVAV